MEIIKQAKNDIIMNYARIIDNDICHEITKKGLFQCLVKEQKMTYNLPDTFHFPYETALSRIKRNNLTACGNDCPIKKVESQFVFILLSVLLKLRISCLRDRYIYIISCFKDIVLELNVNRSTRCVLMAS